MTDNSDSRLTDASLAARPPGPHPTAEQLYRARRGPRTAEAERSLAHAAACAVCTEELLRQEAFETPKPADAAGLATAWKRFGREPQASLAPLAPLAPVIPITRQSRISPVAEPSHPSQRPARQRAVSAGWRWAAAAVIGVIGVGVAGLTGLGPLSHQASRREPLVRGAAELPGTWQPVGLLEAPPAAILFPAPADNEPRRVTVFDVSRSYSWTSAPTTGGRVAFPEAERRKLQAGVEYFWTVVEDESAAARSFRLR